MNLKQVENQEWLEWALNEGIILKSTLPSIYGQSGTTNVFCYNEQLDKLSGSLQIVLQEEVKRLGLGCEINTYGKPSVEIGRNEHERLASCEADTILEAFMLAFKEAWQVLKKGSSL